MATETKKTIQVRVIEKFTKAGAKVEILPVNPKENLHDFFKQFKGKIIVVSAEDTAPTCGNKICQTFGICQGHWDPKDLEETSDKKEEKK